MAAGIEIYNYVTNQKGSPALYSDVLANRPAAGFIGRLFISTDTFEIYRDNGTTWDLISGGGGGVNIYNSNGSLTGARTMTMANHNLTFEGGANPARLIISADNNVAKIFQFRTANVARWDFRVDDNETGGDTGSNWHLRAHNDAGAFTFNPISVTRSNGEKSFYAQENLTAGTEALAGVFNISAGTYGAGLTFIGGNAHAAQFNNFTIANGGSFTFASSSFVGASGNVLRVQANASGTVTMTPSTPGIRTAAVMLNQIQYNTSGARNLVYTHAANIQTLGILQLITDGSFTVTNAYGVIINDLNEYGNPSTGPGALILTNRWGIYQDSTVDVNYFGGTTLIGTTTNAGYKLDTGTLSARLGGIILQQNAPIITGNNLFTTAANFAIGTASANSLFLCTNTIQRLAIDATGNVGIGTNTPSFKTQINATRNTSALELVMTDRTAVNDYTQIGFGFDPFPAVIMAAVRAIFVDPLSSFDSNLSFHTYSGSLTEKMRITSTGNVGIGTISPAYPLDVRVATNKHWAIGLSGTTQPSLRAGNDSYLSFVNGEIDALPLVINSQSGGNVLVNTTTDAGQRLQINSSLRLVPTSTVPTASAGAMYYDSATNKLKLYDGTSWVDLN